MQLTVGQTKHAASHQRVHDKNAQKVNHRRPSIHISYFVGT